MADFWPICNGSGQTPIDIPSTSEVDRSLEPFDFVDYDAFGPDDMEVINVGYTGTQNTLTKIFKSIVLRHCNKEKRIKRYPVCNCGLLL